MSASTNKSELQPEFAAAAVAKISHATHKPAWVDGAVSRAAYSADTARTFLESKGRDHVALVRYSNRFNGDGHPFDLVRPGNITECRADACLDMTQLTHAVEKDPDLRVVAFVPANMNL